MKRIARVGWGLAALLVAAHASAADRPVVLVDLQESGRTEVLAPVLMSALRPAGMDAAPMSEAANLGEPAVIVLYTGNDYEPEDTVALREFMRGGGGVLCLLGPTSRHADAANDMFGDLGVNVEYTRTPREAVRLVDDPITAGVASLPVTSYRMSISGAGRKPLAYQGQDVVAASASIDEGRLVLLPATMATGERDEAPDGNQVRLLAQACFWLAGDKLARPANVAIPGAGGRPGPQTVPEENPLRPGAVHDPRARPMRRILERARYLPSDDFTGTILVDITAADDNWDLAADTLDSMLDKCGLEVRYLLGQGLQSPLVSALSKPPSLLIIGSTRRFTVDEAVAVAHYVKMGGRVLFLAHAIGNYVIRLVDLNTLLREFGIAVSLVRPDGPTLLEDHPITRGLAPPPMMMRGVNIWYHEGTPVAKAGVRPYLSVWEFDGDGKIAVADAKTLLVGTKAYRSPTREGPPLPFVPLMQATVDWLLEGRAQ